MTTNENDMLLRSVLNAFYDVDDEYQSVELFDFLDEGLSYSAFTFKAADGDSANLTLDFSRFHLTFYLRATLPDIVVGMFESYNVGNSFHSLTDLKKLLHKHGLRYLIGSDTSNVIPESIFDFLEKYGFPNAHLLRDFADIEGLNPPDELQIIYKAPVVKVDFVDTNTDDLDPTIDSVILTYNRTPTTKKPDDGSKESIHFEFPDDDSNEVRINTSYRSTYNSVMVGRTRSITVDSAALHKHIKENHEDFYDYMFYAPDTK